MNIQPIQTKIMQPPQDDLYKELDAVLPTLKDKDVLVVSSKVVAIHEGRCLAKNLTDKKDLVASEADVIIERPYWPAPLTITRGAFIGAAGIDESNSGDYFTMLPKDAFESASKLWLYLTNKYNLTELGIVITDSRSLPLRYGATAVSIGWWGIEPLQDHVGKPDLFGREMQYERSNIVDGIAASAGLVMGEVAECTPLVLIRDIPSIKFTQHNTKTDIISSFEDDTFRVLYEGFLPPK